MMKKLAISLLLACCGCFQTTGDDADLRTVPVTNNPYIVPQHGMLPGQTGQQGPS
jgi:hypothetical protein